MVNWPSSIRLKSLKTLSALKGYVPVTKLNSDTPAVRSRSNGQKKGYMLQSDTPVKDRTVREIKEGILGVG